METNCKEGKDGNLGINGKDGKKRIVEKRTKDVKNAINAEESKKC